MSESSDPPGSLIAAHEAAESAAPFLFSRNELEPTESEVYEVTERFGEFTGERLFAQRPSTYQLVVRMIAEGLSTRSIARACRVSPNSVQAVRRREGIPIDAQKQELLELVRAGARLTVERIVELAPEMDARDASVAFGILTDKLQLLSGEATSIVAHKDVLTHEEFNRLLSLMPEANATEVTKATPEMGFGAEPGAQTAPPAPAPEADPADLGAVEGPRDGKSPDSLQAEASVTRLVTHLDGLEPSPQPRGGGLESPTPREPPIG